MQNTKQTETAGKRAFESKLEDRPGGITVAVSDLGGSKVEAGTAVGKGSNGLFNVVKTAKMHANATNTATDYQVKKGHHFKVGQHIGRTVGGTAYTITAIDTSNVDYDVISVGTTLGLALSVGDALIESSAAGATACALKYTPYGLVGHSFDIVKGDNHLVDCVVRGTAIESNIPVVHSAIKTALPHIRFD